MQQDSVSIHFFKAAITHLRYNSNKLEQICHSIGIDPTTFEQPHTRLHVSQYALFLKYLWADCQDETLGFSPRPRRLGTFATMCHLIIHEKNLAKAIQNAFRFYYLFDDEHSNKLEIHGEYAHFVVEVPERLDPVHFNTEGILMSWHGLASWLIKRRIPIKAVHFRFSPPAHATEYQNLFMCHQIKFNMPQNEIIFSAALLEQPIRQNRSHLKKFLEDIPLPLLTKYKNLSSFSARIRKILYHQLGQEEMASLDDIASILNVSSQTLRRRLIDEGKSYQGMKDNLRCDTAIQLLRNHKLTLDDIAQQVGFCEVSTFHKAFKRWTGTTPGAYRQNLMKNSQLQ